MMLELDARYVAGSITFPQFVKKNKQENEAFISFLFECKH